MIKPEIENKITAARREITRLAKLQEEIYEQLVSEVNPTRRGEDFLFDYVFNNLDEEESFLEFSKRIDKTLTAERLLQ